MEKNGEIDTEPPPAVRSLRSKFEQLAQETSPNGNHGEFLAPGGLLSPRPRASSSTFSDSHPEIHHLRSSSSSSDLKAGIKRPPPPPPSRGSKGPTSSPLLPPSSPLLRPVPIPPGVSNNVLASPRLGSSNVLPNNDNDDSSLQSVTSLRNKFNAGSPKPLRSHTPRQSLSSIYPAIQPEIHMASPSSSPKPVLPPRSTRPIQETLSQSPDEYAPPAPRLSTSSPFSDDENTSVNSYPYHTASVPPALPVRRSHVRHTHETSTSSVGEFSQTSSESDLSLEPSSLSRSSRSPAIVPPRPPPRSRVSVSPATFDSTLCSSPSSSSSMLAPPPLPSRRCTVAQGNEISTGPPRLPVRPSLAIPGHLGPPDSPGPSPVNERKTFGSNRLPPPPTRTIALGDKLPPARRAPSPSSDEDSGEEDDPKSQGVDSLPDSSRSSRRPPLLSFRDGYPEPKIHIHSFSGHACVAGTTVVIAHNHHIKVYDVAVSDSPIHAIDTKDVGAKDIKVTSMEFRPSLKREDRGFLVWIGTKDGHIVEIDVRTGSVTGSKYAAHIHAVTHIFRYGRMMLTLDDSGKCLIFAPENNVEDISLAHTQPRVVRIAEKQDFVKLIGGQLWTAARGDQQAIGTALKTPIIRLYDVFAPGSVARTLLPTEPVGAVTAVTMIPSQPDYVYVGHEAGFVTVWLMASDDRLPRCMEVMKISASDVLCLEGVNDRLWAGGRSGLITAYDVSHKPWLVTNSWMAHPGLPVLKLMVDHYGIDKTGRLCVVSQGRDEQLRLWDGLLGLDWVEEELLKRETSFSTFRDLSVLLVSWNCDSARPDSLTGDPANVNFLHEVLHSVESPDIVSFGFQEVIDLESRKMAAKNVLLGSKKKGEDSALSEKVTGAYKRWYDRLILVMRQALPDVPYTVIHTGSLVGLFSCIFIKQSEHKKLADVAVTTIKRGMGGRYGNKGGIVARMVIEDSSICLINVHLAAGQNAVRQRNADVAGMLEEKAVFPEAEHPVAYVGGGDGSMVLDHEIVFVNGDMNYRIDYRRDAIVSAIRSEDLASLLNHDQLLREIKFNRGCRFRGFSEGPLTFPPTYKYDPRSSEYDSSEKRRSPAWCDRVLWKSRIPERVHQIHYQRYEANVSDHRPISAAFTITIKRVKQDVRGSVKTKVQQLWIDEQARLLLASKRFYVQQALV